MNRIMTNRCKSVILLNISKLDMKGSGNSWKKRWNATYNSRPYKIPNSEYYDKIMSLNTIICYKCMNEIKLGEQYCYVQNKSRIRKYYHIECYEGMYY